MPAALRRTRSSRSSSRRPPRATTWTAGLCATPRPAGRAERLFIALAAGGKMSFFGLLVGCWAAGTLPIRLPILGSADLFFGILFLVWLAGLRALAAARERVPRSAPVAPVRHA